jgi:hypothetical protein
MMIMLAKEQASTPAAAQAHRSLGWVIMSKVTCFLKWLF